MKKLVSILMAAVLLLCAVPVLAEGQTYTVGVCQLVTHDALDAATQGFIDALTEELGDAVTFDVQNAAGDSNTCSTIVNSFVAADVDLILANATAALQAAVAATADIPILGTSVTEYGVALDIDDFTGTVGGNVSGTSDLAPLRNWGKIHCRVFSTRCPAPSPRGWSGALWPLGSILPISCWTLPT